MNIQLSHLMGIRKCKAIMLMVKGLIFVTSLLGLNLSAQAACSVQNMTTIPLQFNVTDTYSGNERPVGSTLYRATYSAGTFGNGTTVTCDQDTTLYKFLTITTAPSGPPVTMTTDYGTGPVYPTNVNGIGVLYFYKSPAQFISQTSPSDPNTFNVKANTPQSMATALTADSGNFDMVLIKTGPISSGSAVSISQTLPHLAVVVSTKQTYDSSALKVVDFPQSGWITITTATCETPDLTVNMGSYDTNKFTGKGYSTEWKDASIVLQNCPTFSGYYANSYTGQVIPLEGGTAGEPSAGRNPNTLTVSLTALNPIVDTTNQVMGLDNGDNAATGVGIQLGYTASITAVPTTPQNIWAPGKSWDIAPPTDGRLAFKIPLAARYYQSAEKVTPGKANAKVTFNIDYK
ncbi:TPA: fimbrial protein [Klebsiella aerogenes]|nr:fimbrial protein [Klebsiella aerogenes]HEJ0416739.1 fimbrial protein [Klebsiella aerogenes]HEM8665044.1 fimbrial protein [Klebsiella aerogenes]